tara:strand:+ start:45 stop:275 length:231 start_codon:yes stop_codon:yes gene_type:complete
LITIRIWYWQFIEVAVWHTGGHKLSRLRQQRWAIKLAKIREKESLIEQRKDLTNWKDMAILYRLVTKRLLTNMVVW